MKITQLTIKNIMGVNCELDLVNPVNVFLGRNGQGKSAIFDAIHWGFTGNLPHRGLKIKKDSGTILSTNGEGGASVSLVTSDGPLLRTEKQAKLPPSELMPESLAAMLNARRVLMITPAERQKVFSEVFKSDSCGEKITAFCQENKIGDKYLKIILRDMDDAAKYATSMRIAAKDVIAEWMEKCIEPEKMVTIDTKLLDLSLFTIAGLEDNLAKRQVALSELRVERKSVDTAALTKELETLEKAAKAYDPDALSLVVNKTQVDLAKANIKNNDCQTKSAESVATVKNIAAQIETMTDMRTKSACPTCTQAISEETLVGILNVLERQLESNAAEGKKLKAKADNAWMEWGNISDDLKVAIKANADACGVYDRGISTIQEIKTTLAEYKPVDETEITGQIDKLTEAVDKYKRLLDQVRTYQAEKFQFETLDGKMQEQIAARDEADRICQLLKPDGDLRKIVMESEVVVDYDPNLLAAWNFGSLQLLADGTIELFGRPVELASESEKFRAGLILTELLSRESGTKMMLIDGIDVLADTRGVLQNRLTEWCKTYDTILVNSATKSKPLPGQLLPVPGVSYWWVEGGQISQC